MKVTPKRFVDTVPRPEKRSIPAVFARLFSRGFMDTCDTLPLRRAGNGEQDARRIW